jgi:phospholipid/cholesterol/gamma-HCH transport system permease protein
MRPAKSLFVSFFEWFGELGIFCGRLAKSAFTPPFEGRELLSQLDEIGSRSFPLVALAGEATGVVLSLQLRDSLARFGGESLLPEVIVFSLVKETGPMITALVVAGRVGAGHRRGIGLHESHRADRRHGGFGGGSL